MEIGLTDEIKDRMREDWRLLYLENGEPVGIGYSVKTKMTYRTFEQFFRVEFIRYLTEKEMEQMREKWNKYEKCKKTSY